jgi:hypothetical protein
LPIDPNLLRGDEPHIMMLPFGGGKNREFALPIDGDLLAAFTDATSRIISEVPSIPTRLGELLSDPDKEKTHRVMNAMLQMRKIIVTDLERA